MKYLDFHTHASGCNKYLNDKEVIVVQSLQWGELPHPRANYATLGIHPMLPDTPAYLQQIQHHPKELQLEWVKQITQSNTPIIGIGECGWDKRATISLEEQNQLVRFQVEIANQLMLPVIFHVVGGWQHLLALQSIAQTPWVVHGFRGKPQLAQQLSNAGIYLSLHPFAPTPPIEPFLLETDDTPIHIRTHYEERGTDICSTVKLFSNLFLP